ncbi:glycosyltransferase family 4 protein [Clostridium beijerinckii]|uniref:Glycosyltransferase involved in cell wall biosynthesis n=1 Tax=Clostridium beijerinckii TaxID=1520 RepID=A0AAX0B8L8_CLOBE|nr:glycosyltransferase family 1 protein [Clostridium beijerinckii]NRT90804.1 glycosyltransferase involved in cell wall biosynthesis [Clostridium beijerinckii]NYC70329.1 glycosyltransferase involved in cell wall biosynthesis [Clostridium beijerinckii]
MNGILLNGLLYEGRGAGISKYTQMILKTFIEENYNIDILLRDEFKNNLNSQNLIYAKQNITGSKNRIIYEQLKAQKLYKNYDLVHFPDYATPLFYKGKKIATIHDMAMYTMRDKYTKMQIMTKDILMRNTIKNADRLICVSEFSKKELIKYYPEVEEKATVVYSGIDIPKYNIQGEFEANILQKYNIEKDNYILYVGTIAPPKNIHNLIKAYVKACCEGLSCKLVIAGKKGWMYEEIFKYVNETKMEKNIIFTDYISDLELEALYRNAKIFSSISFYEGFGFPPLEAIGRGIPVLLSNIDIFKEICKDSALYCDPYDIKDISDNMLKLVGDKVLQNKLKSNGEQLIKIFDWSKTAKDIYDIYLDVLK